MKKQLVLLCILTLMITVTGVYASGDTDAQKAIAAATAAQKKADSLQGGWRSTDKLIKKAKKAAAKGDSKKAARLAANAKREAELAYTQAEYERKNWAPPFYARPAFSN